MENEIRNLMKVVITIVTSLTYSYFISSRTPKGVLRLLSLLPIIYIFVLLPLLLSSVILQLIGGAFIAWLCNFKLLLLAFDKGPLTAGRKSVSLLHFIFLASLPIIVKEKPNQNVKVSHSSLPQITTKHLNSYLKFVVNTLFWFLLICLYYYKDFMNPTVIRVVHGLRMTVSAQVGCMAATILAQLVLGCELEQPFNSPLLSTSLQNFWGRRWSLMSHDTLKNTTYMPIKSFLTPMLGRRWAINLAIMSTFGVSGLMHELIYFYVSQVWPTWEVTWFFLIHGASLAIEIEFKQGSKGRSMLHQWISRCLVVAFLLGTSSWLCYIQLMKCGADVREIKEYMALVEYIKKYI